MTGLSLGPSLTLLLVRTHLFGPSLLAALTGLRTEISPALLGKAVLILILETTLVILGTMLLVDMTACLQRTSLVMASFLWVCLTILESTSVTVLVQPSPIFSFSCLPVNLFVRRRSSPLALSGASSTPDFPLPTVL